MTKCSISFLVSIKSLESIKIKRGILVGKELLTNLPFAKWLYKRSFPILAKLSPKIASQVIYYKTFGQRLDLKNPITYTEKLMWLKLNEDDSLKALCTDKYLVRDYISNLGYSDILIDLYHTYESVEVINFDELPNEFVMKCTHGSGFNIVCKNKKELDQQHTIELLNKWMKTDFSLLNSEPHYSKVKPRIIVERFLEGENGHLPIDYKIHCFHGEPKFVEVILDRGVSKPKVIILTREWTVLPYTFDSLNLKELPRKPEELEEMLKVASTLCKDFTYVRVDLYHTNKIYFGELTFTPDACLDTGISGEANNKIGQLLDISKSSLVYKA